MIKFRNVFSGLVFSVFFSVVSYAQSDVILPDADGLPIDPQVYKYYQKANNLGTSPLVPEILDSMHALAVRHEDKYGECVSLLSKSAYYKALSDTGRYLLGLESLRKLTWSYGFHRLFYYSYHEECAYLINNHYLTDAKIMLDQMFEYAVSDGDIYGLYVCFLCTGHLYNTYNKQEMAVDSYLKAAVILEEHDLGMTPSTAYLLAANSAVRGLKFDQAYNYAKKGLEFKVEPEVRTSLYDIMAFSSFVLGNVDEYETLYKEFVKSQSKSKGMIGYVFSTNVWDVIHGKDVVMDGTLEPFTLIAMKYAYYYIGQYSKSQEYSDSIDSLTGYIQKYSYDMALDVKAARLDNERLESEKLRLEMKNRLDRRRTIIWMMSVILVLVVFFSTTTIIRSRRYVKKLKYANASKDRFVQNMSHEVRTPLNSIIGFSQLITMPEDVVSAREREEYIGYIKNNTNMLLMLVDDVLSSADLESGNYEINPVDTSLEEICKSAMKSIELRIPAGVETVTVTDIPDGCMIHTDPLRVQQLLVNLLTNSCKNTEKGFIRLECSVKEKPGYVIFKVTDSGCGIPKDKADAIFERFYKIDEFKQGSGMGLSICRELAGRMHGRVYLDTSYSDGARFVFEMPA